MCAKQWKPMHPKCRATLLQAVADGYRIVIVSNQSLNQFKNDKPVATRVKGKLGRIADWAEATFGDALPQLPLTAIVCAMKDKNRKPGAGSWEFLRTRRNGGVAVDAANSFYCGDAAGRPGDFADSDKGYAEAVGVRFVLPEDYFR